MQSLKRRILCVEDQHTCEVLDFLLGYSDYDYVLRAATTAAEGLALAQSEQFDLCPDRLSVLRSHQPLEHSQLWRRQVLSDKACRQFQLPAHLSPVV